MTSTAQHRDADAPTASTSPTSPRGGYPEQQPHDLAPLGLVVGSLLRWSWLIIAIAALIGGAAWLVVGEGGVDESGEAVARVGLTQETPWPFYDVELEAGSVLVETAAFREELEDRLGFTIDSIAGSLPEFLAVFDITVSAADADQAAEAANTAAAMVVESAGDDAEQLVTDEIARVDAAMADLQVRIDAAAAETEAAAAELTEVYRLQGDGNDPDLWDQAFVLEERRSRASTEGNDLLRLLTDLEVERASLELRANPLPTFRVLRSAEGAVVDDDSNRLPIAAAAALVGLVGAAAIVVVVDRRVGRVRSRWQLANVCGAPTIPDLRVERDGSIVGSGLIADVIHDRSGDTQSIAVANFTSTLDLTRLAADVTAQGIPCELAAEPGRFDDATVRLIDVTDEFASEDSPRPRSRRCDALLVLASRSESLRSVTTAVARGSSSPGPTCAAYVRER